MAHSFPLSLISFLTFYYSTFFLDNEPPFISCPENMQVTKKTDGSKTKVFWKLPVTFDNSRLPVKIFTQAVNGTEFSEGPHTITYDAVDAVGNKNKCSFTIQVSGEDY